MVTIKDLLYDERLPQKYREKDTGRFASKRDIKVWESWLFAKEELERIEKEKLTPEQQIEYDSIQDEISELEDTFDDDEYKSPHEFFKIKFPNWDKRTERELKSITGRYFDIRNKPSNVMAMKYTLTKLKIEKLQDRLDILTGD